jgi:sec-independent protein translocase protein TatA
MRIQPMHVIVLLLIVMLLFGSQRLPDLAQSVGKSLKIFKNEIKELQDQPTTQQPTAQQPSVPAGNAPVPPGAPPAATPVTNGPPADVDPNAR